MGECVSSDKMLSWGVFSCLFNGVVMLVFFWRFGMFWDVDIEVDVVDMMTSTSLLQESVFSSEARRVRTGLLERNDVNEFHSL